METHVETVTTDGNGVLVSDLVDRINQLIDVTNKQNELLASLSEQVGPVLEQLAASPLGMMMGMKS